MVTGVNRPVHYEAVPAWDLEPGSGLIRPGGDRITNIYPFDAEGEPLERVFLYDQHGDPIDIILDTAADGVPVVTSYPLTADGAPVTNAYPQRQVVRPHPGWDFGEDRPEFGRPPQPTIPPLEGRDADDVSEGEQAGPAGEAPRGRQEGRAPRQEAIEDPESGVTPSR